MNKKIFFFFLAILVMLGYVFKIDKIIVITLSNFTNNIKSSYKTYYINTSNYINKYFNQAKAIEEFQIQTKLNNDFKLKYFIARYELKKLQNILLNFEIGSVGNNNCSDKNQY